MSANDELLGVAKALQLEIDFPADVMAETEALLEAPGIDDPSLIDRTAWPFVTIDGATSKDLDQALFIERDVTGYLVAYAIADAAFYVRPGSALFRDAMKRGASYYFPGFSVPMLPRSLSEGLISLNPGVPRRSLLFLHRLDAQGELLGTTLERARVHSRAKLSFGNVQALIDAPASSPLKGEAYEESLQLLKVVGRLRMALAAKRGLIRYRREEVTMQVDGQGLGFTVTEAVRDEVEQWNEQLSLMCNSEGGRLLNESGSPAVQPIYRVQPGPEESRLDSLARLTGFVAKRWSLPADPWVWNRETTSLADYLAKLPYAPGGSNEQRIVAALTRQAVMVNLRSEYSTLPAEHSGVGAEPYARFSAPMRELVGVYLHKEAVELLSGVHPPAEDDEVLRAQVVEIANKARETQKRVSGMSGALLMRKLFTPELAKPPAERTVFVATVMGITSSKVHVRFDVPPMDVKLYMFDLAPYFQKAWLEPAEEGVVLRKKGTDQVFLKLGEKMSLKLASEDPKTRRWIFAPQT